MTLLAWHDSCDSVVCEQGIWTCYDCEVAGLLDDEGDYLSPEDCTQFID